MAGTLQTLGLKSPAIASPPGRRRHIQSPITYFSFSSIRSLSRSFRSCDLHRRHLFGSCKSIRASNLSHQGNGGEEQLPQVKAENWTKPLLKFASNNFLPLALVGGVALGLANPTPGCIADRLYLSKFSSFGIFVISGLTLRSDEIGAAAEAWQVGLFGLEFITGLAIFSCMPTTLSSGIALTRLAGGNSALALAMTLVSNLLGILILVASGVGVSVPTERLFRSLILTLLVPLIFGKAVRESFKGGFSHQPSQIFETG